MRRTFALALLAMVLASCAAPRSSADRTAERPRLESIAPDAFSEVCNEWRRALLAYGFAPAPEEDAAPVVWPDGRARLVVPCEVSDRTERGIDAKALARRLVQAATSTGKFVALTRKEALAGGPDKWTARIGELDEQGIIDRGVAFAISAWVWNAGDGGFEVLVFLRRLDLEWGFVAPVVVVSKRV